ncbi:MAG: tRNA epoxyqueuosine(34) reductase QueG [Parvibaculales bacterium]
MADASTINIKLALQNEAAKLGFDSVHFVRPDAIPEAGARLTEFLTKGYHGDMEWLETHAERRQSPLHLWPEVKSIIILGMNYAPPDDPQDNPLQKCQAVHQGNISVYASGDDYHDVIKKRLKQLGRWLLSEQAGEEIKVFVDTAPLMEKPLAQAAGMGWQGKHTNLVSREFGSWLFIGSIFTTLNLAPDTPETDHCGSCSACLDICPTDAFPAPYQLDARKCISYLTIEAKQQVPRGLRRQMGNRIYGCDDCLAVCPWNKYARRTQETKLQLRDNLRQPALSDLVQLDDAAFRALFSKSPVKRIGRDRFIRNVLIAIGNAAQSGEIDYLPLIKERLEDSSPLVRGMAVWALSHYVDHQTFKKIAQVQLADEADPDVRLEWEHCLDA